MGWRRVLAAGLCHKNGQRTEKEAFGTKADLETEVVRVLAAGLCHKNGQRTEKKAFGTKADLRTEVVQDRNPAGNAFSFLYLICRVVLRLGGKVL
ncbi:hypothetical protein PET01_18170 [Pediococcus ethanolidurans]|nr:hypothetical protein PET01_18170 [Pediococcus ethanolidurans]